MHTPGTLGKAASSRAWMGWPCRRAGSSDGPLGWQHVVLLQHLQRERKTVNKATRRATDELNFAERQRGLMTKAGTWRARQVPQPTSRKTRGMAREHSLVKQCVMQAS